VNRLILGIARLRHRWQQRGENYAEPSLSTIADRRRSTEIAAVTAIVTAMLLTLVTYSDHEWTPSKRAPIEVLSRSAAKLDHRLIDGRLSGFAYRPVGKAAEAPSANLRAAASNVLYERADLHAVGVGFLLIRRPSRAVDALEQASQAQPQNALLLSDLSVAYYARAKSRNFPPDYAAALDAAERSWRLCHTPESAWNRALIMEAFHATAAAGQAWSDLLRIEVDSGWRAEAEQHRAALRVPTELDGWRNIEQELQKLLEHDEAAIARAVHRFPAPAFAYLEDTLLPQWARSPAEANPRRLGHVIAAALAADGDSFAKDTLDAIDAACRDRAGCGAIARAHAQYAGGRDLIDAQAYAKAVGVFEQASVVFERLRSPYALAARFRQSACLMHENRFTEAGRVASTVITATGNRRYRILLGRCRWHAGLVKLHEARPEESIAQYAAARQLFIDGHDTADLGSIELLLADAYQYAGDRDVAMTHRLACLDAMGKSGDSRQLMLALFEAGTSLSSGGWLTAADFFLAESEREASNRGRFDIAALASMWRSTLSSRRGMLADAGEQSRQASAYWNQMTDPGSRALVAANANQSAVSSAQKLTESIHFFEQAGNRAWLPDLLRQRALLAEREGDLRAAEADYRRAIDMTEQTLDNAAPATMRDGFATDTRANYEDLMRLLLARQASQEALGYAERARLIGKRAVAQRDLSNVINAIPLPTAVAVLEIQGHTVVTWLIQRHLVTLSRVPASSVAELAAASSPKTLTRSYDILMRNWISRIPPETELVIVPPPALAGVPFAALLNRDSGRAVVDDYPVSVAPSLASLSEPSVTLSASDPILIVGDPQYRDLPLLPRSRQEAINVARRYAHPTLLLGAAATAGNVARQLGNATVFQFGGHAVANDFAPEMSSLLLAPEDGEDSRIYVHELLARRLPLKLVVLSACSTARNRAGSARGTLTIGRAFIDGGTRAVVGTLWPVSDDAAATFSISLHDALAHGNDLARAARAAQLHVRSIANRDASWAAFCLLLGNVSHKEVHH
jgi:CHAT domain-containing protein